MKQTFPFKNYHKIILLCVFLFINCVETFAQRVNTSNCKKETSAICNINADRIYSAIVNTDIDKKELVVKIQSFLIFEKLVSRDKLRLVKYDDNLQEYVIPLYFRKGMTMGKSSLGMKALKTPVKLYFDGVFTFNNEGQIKVSFTNFKEESFIMVVKDKKEYKMDYSENEKEIHNAQSVLEVTESGIGKFLLIANGVSLDKIQEAREEFIKEVDEEFKMLDAAVQRGNAKWLTDSEICDYSFETVAPNNPMAKWSAKKGNNYYQTNSKKLVAAGKLVNVDNEIWDNYFQKQFNYFYKKIVADVTGDIEAVALDGEVKFVNESGEILPTNSKLRNKWKRKNITF